MGIYENVKEIREKIAEAAKKSGRRPDEIKLIGVTKTIETDRIKELLAAGVEDIGENKVQEFLPKYDTLEGSDTRPARWHFIGHLQRNKVKFIADKVDLIHSVDSLPLAEEINKRAGEAGRKLDVLAEVNIAGETAKYGFAPDSVLSVVEKLQKMSNIQLTGLMCVAPFVENPEKNRVYFEKMRSLCVDIQSSYLYYTTKLDLSMGMTGDFTVAIEEGATMVRIGTALFGNRATL